MSAMRAGRVPEVLQLDAERLGNRHGENHGPACDVYLDDGEAEAAREFRDFLDVFRIRTVACPEILSFNVDARLTARDRGRQPDEVLLEGAASKDYADLEPLVRMGPPCPPPLIAFSCYR
jgi:hypothetical protein